MRQLRKTKIICTIGPASDSEDMLVKLIDAGMNVARLNFSHGTHSEHKDRIDKIKAAREKCDEPIAIMLDTKGPEFRVKQFVDGHVDLCDGQEFILTTDEVEGDNTRVSVTYKDLTQDLDVNDIILANDGLIKLQVTKIVDTNIHCNVVVGGKLSNNKSLNFPGKSMDMEYLSDNDKSDILFGIENDVDYIACSFVSRAKDVKSVRKFLHENGGEEIDIIAKIENQSGIDNLKSILKHCVGAMVARGDLGVEIPFDELPGIQKSIINKCSKYGKIAITATEMLESMIEKPRPTRAEVSDIGNAVFDGVCAIMLSGETAMGKYPIESVKVMSKIALSSELSKAFHYKKRKEICIYDNDSSKSAIAHGTFTMADDAESDIILNFTETGEGSKTLSNFRSKINIVSAAYNKKEYNKLSLYWSVLPFYIRKDSFNSYIALSTYYIEEVIRYFDLHKGDKIVVCYAWLDSRHNLGNGVEIYVVK